MFDIMVHQETTVRHMDGLSVINLWNELRKKVTGFEEGEGSFCGTFGQIMTAYDAGFYVYLWGKVISFDIFYSKFSDEQKQDGKSYADNRC